MATASPKPIATTNEVNESAVIRAPLSHVWHFIKLPDFPKFWSAIERAEHVEGTSSETDVVRWTFKDGSVAEVKQDEHSVSSFVTSLSRRTAQSRKETGKEKKKKKS